ncbi:MAG: hypothetical protein IKG00_09655 [Lachnospiraceae bacterium]|nr:hypothetical protein [Lachnospiraceae bacterium]
MKKKENSINPERMGNKESEDLTGLAEDLFWKNAHAFTQELRQLLTDNPGLDVIPFFPPFSVHAKAGCSIALVREPTGIGKGRFTKKVIVMHDAKMFPFSDEGEKSLLDIPFIEKGGTS